jgi:ABC-type phosphate transport system permease subunit
MTAVKPRSQPVRSPQHARPTNGARPRRRVPAATDAAAGSDLRIYLLPMGVGAFGMAVAFVTMFTNATDLIIAPLLVLLGLADLAPVLAVRSRTRQVDRPGAILAAIAIASGLVVALIPQWMFGADINGIVNRTVVSGPLLLGMGTAASAWAILRLNSGSPSGQDKALIPIFTVAIVIGVVGYLVILGKIAFAGIGEFTVGLLTTAWKQIAAASGFTYQIGFLNNILGTLLLLTLTLVFASLPGIGAGVFMNEYPGRLARVMDFCTTMLRAISIFLIGAVAVGVVKLGGGLDSTSFLSILLRGGFWDGTTTQAERGSFLIAAVFLAMLVMPVIARLTEEGLRSVPREIREGSVALGATDGYSLRRILIPWAAPNIVTALILAGAEAAGGLAVIVFIAGPGQNGVGLLNGVTTLDYAVFATHYGPRVYWQSMQDYQFTAALLLLLLTVVLTAIAMTLRRRFALRYRGTLTAQ